MTDFPPSCPVPSIKGSATDVRISAPNSSKDSPSKDRFCKVETPLEWNQYFCKNGYADISSEVFSCNWVDNLTYPSNQYISPASTNSEQWIAMSYVQKFGGTFQKMAFSRNGSFVHSKLMHNHCRTSKRCNILNGSNRKQILHSSQNSDRFRIAALCKPGRKKPKQNFVFLSKK